MPVALRCEIPAARKCAPGVRANARQVMLELGLSCYELSIVLADDDFIRRLNRDFRAKDKPTDVLSFPQLDESAVTIDGSAGSSGMGGGGACRPVPSPTGRRRAKPHPITVAAPPGAPLGDIVISVETARAQALRLGVTEAERLRTLLIHGVLHLLGYDHERSRADARRMFARERELAAALALRTPAVNGASAAAAGAGRGSAIEARGGPRSARTAPRFGRIGSR